MEANKKIDLDIVNKLSSNNPDNVSSSLEIIKKKKEVDYFIAVINALSNASDKLIRNLLSNYIFNLKDESVKAIVISLIKDEKNKNILTELVSSCWQSGMNYSDHFVIFTDILIKEDFITAIEAYSVIESMLDDLNKDEKELIANKLINSLSLMDATKKSFVTGLIEDLQQ